MEFKQIKELMAAMERAGLKKVSVKEKDGFEVHLERHDEALSHPHPQPSGFHPVYHAHPPFESHHRFASMPEQQPPMATAAKEESKSTGKHITSPMVGTFYTAASPEDPIFVKVGDKVEENTVVCIIEAMKVMNEVKAGMSGVISEICIENAHPVEFGTKLFKIS